MTIDIERLKTDLDYWNEVAPEGAEAAYTCDSIVVDWYKPGASQVYSRRASAWITATELDIRKNWLIPRPSPAWNGEGLPPVGVECEYRCRLFGCSGKWFRCTVRYVLDCDHGDDADGWQAVMWCPHLGKEQFATADDFLFRPLKTEKERVVEAVYGAINPSGTYVKELIEEVYDAGALKMPGGE